jgi:hypothetical protein
MRQDEHDACMEASVVRGWDFRMGKRPAQPVLKNTSNFVANFAAQFDKREFSGSRARRHGRLRSLLAAPAALYQRAVARRSVIINNCTRRLPAPPFISPGVSAQHHASSVLPRKCCIIPRRIYSIDCSAPGRRSAPHCRVLYTTVLFSQLHGSPSRHPLPVATERRPRTPAVSSRIFSARFALMLGMQLRPDLDHLTEWFSRSFKIARPNSSDVYRVCYYFCVEN